MLDTLLDLPFALNRHRDAPLLEERIAFLKYLQERGTSSAALGRTAASERQGPQLCSNPELLRVCGEEVAAFCG